MRRESPRRRAAQSEKSGAAAEKMPGKGAAVTTKVRGTIDAIDKDKGTVTLKGPKGRTVTLEVQGQAEARRHQGG